MGNCSPNPSSLELTHVQRVAAIPSEHWSASQHSVKPNPHELQTLLCPFVRQQVMLESSEDDEKESKTIADGWELCNVACRAKNENIFDEDAVVHLSRFFHGQRETCKFGQECEQFLRLEQNKSNLVEDEGHMLIFVHPPRVSRIERIQGAIPMSTSLAYPVDPVFSHYTKARLKMETMINASWSATLFEDSLRIQLDYLPFLVIEVIDNGFGLDLVLDKPKDLKNIRAKTEELDRMTWELKLKLHSERMTTASEALAYMSERPVPLSLLSDIDKSLVTILSTVQNKLDHPRHLHILANFPHHCGLTFGQMLSIILYSGCDCNYEMCSHMRKGNVLWTWSIFIFCLNDAIAKLHRYDTLYPKDVPVYSGIGNVFVTKDHERVMAQTGLSFSTFVSTSRSLWVAKQFRQFKGGLLLRILPEQQQLLTCCDISWISKFQDEQEVLVSPVQGGRGWKIESMAVYLVGGKYEQFFDVSQY